MSTNQLPAAPSPEPRSERPEPDASGPRLSALDSRPAGALIPAPTPAQRLLAAFLASKSPKTLHAYAADLDDFARWSGAASSDEATRQLLAAGHGPANEAALNYRSHLLAEGLASATINRRLAALRSLSKLARTLGLASWALEVPAVRSEAYRDTSGPSPEGVRKLLVSLASRSDAKALRDRCLVQLLYHLGLRRNEVVTLDLEDLDLEAGIVAMLGQENGRGGGVSTEPGLDHTNPEWEDWHV